MKNKKILYIFLHVPKCGGTTFIYHIKFNFKEEESLYLYRGRGFFNMKTKRDEYLNSREDVIDYLNSLSNAQKDKIKIIYGHDVFYGIHKFFDKTPRYITFLREPFARVVSEYNHLRKVAFMPRDKIFDVIGGLFYNREVDYSQKYIMKDNKSLSFQDWLINYYHTNSLLDFFFYRYFLKKRNVNLKDIENCLNKFYFIGLTENFEDDALFLYDQLKINQFFFKLNVSKKFVTAESLEGLRKHFLSQNSVDKMIYDCAIKFNGNLKKNPRKIRNLKIKQNIIRPFSHFYLLFKIRFRNLYYNFIK